MKLSKTQEKVLNIMEYEDWYSAADLECSLATLYALENKGMIIRESNSLGLRWLGSERYDIVWQITRNENEQ